MPPTRNIPSAKPLKTERTHEENQERAYIAASRRSDRSIEARLESAKRASEVHKKRTGRALRVTQEDVENEEMYEEEDGDLQMNFRNLAAQWYANSPEFNRKLQAYLATQALVNNAPNNFMMGSQFGTQQAAQYAPNPFLAQLVQQRIPQQTQQQQPQQQQQIQSPQSPSRMTQMTNLPHSYRQSPYPLPTGQGYHPPNHTPRSASTAIPNEKSGPLVDLGIAAPPTADRRNSLPVNAEHPASPTIYTRPQPQATDSNMRAESASSPNTPQSTVRSPSSTSSTIVQQTRPPGPSHSFPMPATYESDQSSDNSAVLGQTAAALGNFKGCPLIGQSFFSSGVDARQTPFYSYNPNLSKPSRSPDNGMSQTLSPGSATLGPTLAGLTEDYMSPTGSDSYAASLPSGGLLSGGADYSWQFGNAFDSPGFSTDPAPFGTDEWATFLNDDALEDSSA